MSRVPENWIEVDTLIYNADLKECLNSSSLYINECKKWFQKSTLEELIYFFSNNNMISFKTWTGAPLSQTTAEEIYNSFILMSTHLYEESVHFPSNKELRKQANANYSMMCAVDRLIKDSSPAIALTSSLEYVRECKKWFMKGT